MDITTRAEWGARRPDPGPFPSVGWSSRTGFVIHYSAASKTQTVRAIQNYQMDTRGWRDIGYNFLVDYRGVIYEGCQGTWSAVGAHVAGHNTANIGVCAIGTNADITEEQKRSLRWLYDEANRRAGKTLSKRYHSGMSGASTSCPGDRLRAWVISGMPIQQEDDMLTDEDLGRIATAVHNIKIGKSEVTFAQVLDALRVVPGQLTTVQRAVEADRVDELAIAQAVLAGLDAEFIAAAIPEATAQRVVDLLVVRLAS